MHIEKYKKGAVGGIIEHDERASENHTNEQIDPSRSHLNYNLAEGQAMANYQARMKEVFCLKRDDINTLASIVLSLPEEVQEKDQEEFFQLAYNHLAEKIGKKNVVSAYVHLDETTPHMHFKFIPIYENEKEIKRGKDKGKVIKREQVSYDEVCDREFYQKLHQDMQAYMDKKLGYKVGILNGKTIVGVENVNQLKALTEVKQELEANKQQLEKVSKELETKNKALELVSNQLASTDKKLDGYIDGINQLLSNLFDESLLKVFTMKRTSFKAKNKEGKDISFIRVPEIAYKRLVGLLEPIKEAMIEAVANVKKEQEKLQETQSMLKQIKEMEYDPYVEASEEDFQDFMQGRGSGSRSNGDDFML